MNLFLRAKHWQLFLVMFAFPIILQIVMMAGLFSTIGRNPNPAIVFNYLKLFPLIMLIYMGTLFGWQWSIAIGLQKFVPPGVKMKITKFKIFFIIHIVYLTLILLGLVFVFNSHFLSGGSEPPVAGIAIGFGVIFPIHIFSMFCIFYCLYFVAKTFKTVELQKEVSFGDFAGEFFMMWFYPIGIWIVQPKINKIVAVPPEELNTNV